MLPYHYILWICILCHSHPSVHDFGHVILPVHNGEDATCFVKGYTEAIESMRFTVTS